MPRINPDKEKQNKDNSKHTSKIPLIEAPKKEKKKKVKRGRAKSNIKYFTHDGHPLTPLEAKFLDLYIETGNQRQAVIEAGYKTNSPGQYAQTLLKKDYIATEIAYRLKELENQSIAGATEILQYFTSVMRGEVEDQFGLEAPLAERTKAAQELAKRQIDIMNKVNGKDVAEVKITLNWEGMENGEQEGK